MLYRAQSSDDVAAMAALQMYNGALDEPAARYAGKVAAEKARLRQFLVAAPGGG